MYLCIGFKIERHRPDGFPVNSKTMKTAKEIAQGIVNAYMQNEGEFIRKQFEGLNDEQAKVMAMTMAALMLKNNLSRI